MLGFGSFSGHLRLGRCGVRRRGGVAPRGGQSRLIREDGLDPRDEPGAGDDVRVDEEEDLAPSGCCPGVPGCRCAAILVVADDTRSALLCQGCGLIFRAVVHDDDLEVGLSLARAEALEAGSDVVRSAVGGDHDRDEGTVHVTEPSSLLVRPLQATAASGGQPAADRSCSRRPGGLCPRPGLSWLGSGPRAEGHPSEAPWVRYTPPMLHFDPLTRGSTILAALVTLSLPLGCSPGSGGVAPDPRALLQGESLEQVDGPAWVVFADKGSEGEEALGAAESLLHPRALARRSLNRPDGTRVDWRDLPVRPDYVDALEELGVRIRHVVPRLNAVSVESLGERHGEVAGLPFVQEIRPVAQRVQPELPELGPAPTAPRGTEELPVSPYDYGGGTWQVELVNAQLMHGVGLTGAGVVVGLADTGFRLTHEVLEPLQAQVIDEYDFLEDAPVVAIVGPLREG